MEENQESNKQPRKKRHFFIIFCLVLVVGALATAKYLFSEKNYQIFKTPTNGDQFSNIDTKIYNKDDALQSDLSSNQTENKSDSEQLVSVNDEYKLKDLYSNLVKQQLQIDVLQEKYISLKGELEKIRNQDKLSKIIIGFIEVKDCIDAQKNCSQQLEKLSLLSKNNSDMEQKISDLREALKYNPKSSKLLQNEFRLLIPEIMSIKPTMISESFFDKIKRNIAKLVVIRRVDGVVGKSSENIDFIIVETEKLIEQDNYQSALNLLSNQEEIYKPVLEKIIVDLQNADRLHKAISDMLNYLKSCQNLKPNEV